jgi:hypothetical protein
MKTIKNVGSLFFWCCVIVINLVCCNKDDKNDPAPDEDYRSNFVGTFNFKICGTSWWLTPDSIYWKNWDTIFTSGSIELYHKNQLLIKYNSSKITGIWREDTINCLNLIITAIDDSLVNNPPSPIGNYYFVGYYDNWVSPIFHVDSTLEIPCTPYRLTGGIHEAFGGYFKDTDSLYLFYSSGGLGGGIYKYIYGKRK